MSGDSRRIFSANQLRIEVQRRQVNEEKDGITVNFTRKGQAETPMISGDEACPICSKPLKEHKDEEVRRCTEQAKRLIRGAIQEQS